MNVQEIIVGVLAVAAIIYLISFLRKQTQSHNCDECGLMEMQKEKMRKKSAKDS